MFKIFNANTKTVFKYGSTTAGAAAIVNDVLTPLSKMGLWLCFTALLLAIIVLIIGRKNPDIFNEKSGVMQELWYVPLCLSCILVAVSTAGIYKFNKDNNNKNGILSKHSEVVKLLQKDLGILSDINKTLKSIDLTTQKIDKNTSVTAKLITTRSYNEHDFIESISNANMLRLENYLTDFWKNTYIYPKMTGESFILFEGIRVNNSESVVAVLKLFHQHGRLDPSKLYSHPLPMYAPKVIYQQMVQAPLRKSNEQKRKKYEQNRDEANRNKKALAVQVNEKIELHCKEIDELNRQSIVKHKLAKEEWEHLYQEAVLDTNNRRQKKYELELIEHNKNKNIIHNEHAEFAKKRYQDFESHEQWLKKQTEIQIKYSNSFSAPFKKAKTLYPDNYQELRAKEPSLVAPQTFCNKSALKIEFEKKLVEGEALIKLDLVDIPYFNHANLTLLQYAIAVKNHHASKYLYGLLEEDIEVHVELFDYNDKMIFKSNLLTNFQ
jgi:hypothetical protein